MMVFEKWSQWTPDLRDGVVNLNSCQWSD